MLIIENMIFLTSSEINWYFIHGGSDREKKIKF